MNFQNLPRDDGTVKGVFIPKLDVFCSWDYQAMEMRLLAFYIHEALKDETLAEYFRKDKDPHTETAANLFHISPGQVTKEQRTVGKTLNFSIIYGGGRPTIKKQLHVDDREAAYLLKTYHDKYPAIKQLRQLLSSSWQNRGYIQTLWGRRLQPDSEHKLLNALIQGSAAEITKHALVRLREFRADLKSHFVLMVHDDILWDCKLDEVTRLYHNVPDLMKYDRVDSVVPLATSFSMTEPGESWATKKEMDKLPDWVPPQKGNMNVGGNVLDQFLR